MATTPAATAAGCAARRAAGGQERRQRIAANGATRWLACEREPDLGTGREAEGTKARMPETRGQIDASVMSGASKESERWFNRGDKFVKIHHFGPWP
jgi:hypothetical protein